MKTYLEKETAAGLFDEDHALRSLSEASPSWLRQSYRQVRGRIQRSCRLWLLKRSSPSGLGKLAASAVCWGTKPYHGRAYLADLLQKGFVAPSASISDVDLRLGANVYIGDRVDVSQTPDGGPVNLGDKVHLYGNSFLETGAGAMISIGAGTHVQPGCHLHAHLSNITIGVCVEIAANCGFFSYDHGAVLGRLIMEQPLESKGDIRIGDGAWLGYGVTVLQGVTIGAGAVIGAGSVVNRDIPDNAIAAGVPAKVLKYRASETA